VRVGCYAQKRFTQLAENRLLGRSWRSQTASRTAAGLTHLDFKKFAERLSGRENSFFGGVRPRSRIKEWGWTSPALVGEDGGLIAGHARILAARQLGISEIPVMAPSRRARARAREAAGNQRPWPADKVERWSIDRLIPYAKNARTHTDAQVAAIAASPAPCRPTG
jgi:hypothetical protein